MYKYIIFLFSGYQQEQNCDEAAKVFLETSPDLGEHRTVTKRNGTYGKKCNYKYLCKLSLLDILHEYCEISKLGKSRKKLKIRCTTIMLRIYLIFFIT